MARPRVAHVTSAAIAGDCALITGYAAWFLARVIDGVPGGLDAVLARSGVPPDHRLSVLRAHAALSKVGARWRLEEAAAAGSGSGTANTTGAESGLASNGDAHALLGSREAASAFGVTDRQVRKLASTGRVRAGRDLGGRWQFEPAVIEAELAKRRGTG